MKTLPIFLSLTSASFSASILWDPLPYFSEADSPFYQGILDGTIYLEDFEDQALNTPFVREPDNVPYFGFTYRQLIPSISNGSVRSVDSDDGVIDFNGDLGDTWITTANPLGGQIYGSMAFEFLPNTDGLYPKYVGIVITAADDLRRAVELSFRDLDGNNLFADTDLYDPMDWVPFPQTAEDTRTPRTHRFIGAYHEDGIARLSLSNVWQVYHLQYGYAIPEPSPPLLVLTTLIPFLRRRRFP
jgi:hypothetical protein